MIKQSSFCAVLEKGRKKYVHLEHSLTGTVSTELRKGEKNEYLFNNYYVLGIILSTLHAS